MSEIEEKLQSIQLEEFESDSESEISDFYDSDYEDSSNNTNLKSTTNTNINTNATTNTNTNTNASTNKVTQHKEKKPLDKAQILSKYSDKIKTDEFVFKRKQLSKDKSDRATVENVLDPRTVNFMIKLIRKGTITKINGCLSTGKEANVYHAENELTGKEYAIKVYKTSILVFKDRERYVDGEFRFRNARSQHNPRKMIKIWAEKEFRNLKRLHVNGMHSPEPIDLKSHVLIMEFLSNGDGFPSPKLRDYPFESYDEIVKFYHEMIYCIRFMYQTCRLVHADLSEYNSIVHNGELYIFDVSQSVEPEHPMSLDFLRMDIKNVNDFFMKKGIDVIPERLIFKFIIEELKTLNIESETKENLLEYIKNLPLKSGDEEEIANDEVFRSIHLVRSLNHLEERDFDKFTDGKIDTLKDLVGSVGQEIGDSDNEGNEEEENEDGDYEDDESSDENEEKEWKERITELKGKKHEDKDDKKERKLKAKEEAREKRKTKMKKYVKKKLVNKGKSK